ncbi:MAG: hypothetical protein Q8K82_14520 [Gemmatimonadaceae bacterium]|nr:hypothetical protein [Gemmatimonadaceae bacterium]
MDDKQQGGVEQAMQRRREREAEVARTGATLRVLQAEMREALDACDRVGDATLLGDAAAAARAWSPLWYALAQLWRVAVERCGAPPADTPCPDDDVADALWRSARDDAPRKEFERELANVLRELGGEARLRVHCRLERLRDQLDVMHQPLLAKAIEEELRARGLTVPVEDRAAQAAPNEDDRSAPADAPVEAPIPAAPTERESERIAHAPDFAWIRCGRDVHHFATPKQRQIIEMLFGQWKGAGCVDGCGMSEAAVAEHCEFGTNDLRIKRTFSGTTALNTILRKVADDTWALFLNSSP